MKKYCLFDGGDIVGPFTVKQLLLRTGFGDNSLVCPEEHTAEDSYWKEARQYPDFGFQGSNNANDVLSPVLVVPPVAQADQFSDELDDVVAELSSFDVLSERTLPGHAEFSEEPAPVQPAEPVTPKIQTEGTNRMADADETNAALTDLAPADEEAEDALQQATQEVKNLSIPAPQVAEQQTESQTPTEQAQPVEESVSKQSVTPNSPIEEYFNTMRGGDLGNILGMPDPRLNSDLNLARTLEKQTAQNTQQDPLPAGEPMTEQKTQEPNVAADNDEQMAPPEQIVAPSEEPEAARAEKEPLALENQTPLLLSEPTPQTQLQPAAEVQEKQAFSEEDQAAQTVRDILAGTLRIQAQQEITEPIKQVSRPAPGKIEEFEQEQRPLKQRVVDHRQEKISNKQTFGFKTWLPIALGVIVVLGSACVWKFMSGAQEMDELLPEGETLAATNMIATSTAAAAAPAATAPVVAVAKTPQDIAKETVQQYQLSAGRGSISQYFAQHYSDKLASGYMEQWSAERLHNDVYVVKYRLAKTRQEPIVYIFQVDTAKKKLTGALNNITLDLVGKLK